MVLRYKPVQRLLLGAAILGLLLLTAIAYWPGLTGGFMFDDIPNIVRNPGLVLTSLAPHELLRAAFSSRSGILYRPISMLSFALNGYLFGPEPYSFKLTNVFVHLVNALLILWLTFRLLWNCRQRFQFKWSDTQLRWTAVIIAAAWALHPLNLTAVLYIVQRMTSLAALFTLAGMLSYLYGRERSLAGKTGWALVWLLTPFFGVLGVLSKEDAALLPLYLLVIEYSIFGFRRTEDALTYSSHQRDPGFRRGMPKILKTPDSGFSRKMLLHLQNFRYPWRLRGNDEDRANQKLPNQRHAKNVIVFYIVGLVLPGLVGIVYLIHQHFWAGFAGRSFTLPERVLTEFRVVFLYVKWTFFPNIRELALYHDDIVVSMGLLHPATTLLSLLALLAILALAFWQRNRRPLLCLGILFFFAGQAMESTVLPLELAFEHRNYLPDYGLILAFFSLLLLPGAAGERVLRPSLRWIVAIIILPVLLSVTLTRAWEWKNPLSFAYYETRHHPHSERALYALGYAYSNLALAGTLKSPELALHTLEHSAALSTNIMPDVAMMIVSAKLNRPVDPAWIKHAQWLLRNRPVSVQDTNSLNSMVNCLPTSCKALAQPALTLLQTALQPGTKSSKNPNVWVIYGNYLTFTDQPLDAVVAALREAVKLAPTNSQYRINLAKGYIMTGDLAGAQAEISALTRLNFLGHLDVTLKQLNADLTAARSAGQHEPHTGPSTPSDPTGTLSDTGHGLTTARVILVRPRLHRAGGAV